MDAYTPLKGKCTWWREVPNQEDAHSMSIKDADKRVNCTCFVEGHYWVYTRSEVPSDCPRCRGCRYHIRHT